MLLRYFFMSEFNLVRINLHPKAPFSHKLPLFVLWVESLFYRVYQDNEYM